jgi:hypothetical protein
VGWLMGLEPTTTGITIRYGKFDKYLNLKGFFVNYLEFWQPWTPHVLVAFFGIFQRLVTIGGGKIISATTGLSFELAISMTDLPVLNARFFLWRAQKTLLPID